MNLKDAILNYQPDTAFTNKAVPNCTFNFEAVCRFEADIDKKCDEEGNCSR